MFSFKWLDSPETRAAANVAFEQSEKKFRKFLGSRPATRKLYDQWWFFQGPTGFVEHDDMTRYRELIWERVQIRNNPL